LKLRGIESDTYFCEVAPIFKQQYYRPVHIYRKINSILKSNSNIYKVIDELRSGLIARASMVLHLGAHVGSECHFYNSFQKKVVWIEANPEIYSQLKSNIAAYPEQRAILGLLGHENRDGIHFNVANNQGQSSSIYKFGRDMNHEGLSMVNVLNLEMKRLDSMLGVSDVHPGSHWVVDVQGSELQVLQGSGKLIENAYSMEVEVSTKEEYLGGTKFAELNLFLNSKGLYPLWPPKLNSHEDLFFIRRTQ